MRRVPATRRDRFFQHLGGVLIAASGLLGVGVWLWTPTWWLAVPWVLVTAYGVLGEVRTVSSYRMGYLNGVTDFTESLRQGRPLLAEDPHPADRYRR